MKKVLFINTRLIYPTTGGRQVVLYNYCKGLKEMYGCKVEIISFLDSGDEKYIKSQPNFVEVKKILNQPNLIEKIYNILINSFILKKWPIQVSIYYSRKNQKIINEYIEEQKPDIIICDMIRTSQYIVNNNDINCNKILDMDDLISKRYGRQIENGVLGIDSIGSYINRLPKILRGILNAEKIMKLIFKFEYKVLKKYEIYLKDFFDKFIFVSPIEAEYYNKICDFENADYVTIGVDYSYYSDKISEIKNKEIVYLGNMNVSHNKKAVEFFIKNILPKINDIDDEVIFKIVGKCDDKRQMDTLTSIKNVVMTGEVKDIREHVQQGTVSVAYLQYGSGIKTKILETLAMGVPVITNSIGAEGIIYNENCGLIVEDDLDKFIAQVIRLINDKKLNEELSQNAQNFISQNYQWDTTLKRMKKMI